MHLEQRMFEHFGELFRGGVRALRKGGDVEEELLLGRVVAHTVATEGDRSESTAGTALHRCLRGGELPLELIALVLEESRQLDAVLHGGDAQTQQVAIHTAAVHGVLHGAHVAADGLAQEMSALAVRYFRVLHGVAEGLARDAARAGGFGAAVREQASLRTLVGEGVAAGQLLVGELQRHLHEGVRRHAAALGEVLAKVLEAQDVQVDTLRLLAQTFGGGLHPLGGVGGQIPLQRRRRRQTGGERGAARAGVGVRVVLLLGQQHVGQVVGNHRGVGPGVLCVDGHATVLGDDDLHGLVEPAVAAVRVEGEACLIDEGVGALLVQTEAHERALDAVDRGTVALRLLDQLDALLGPGGAVLCGEHAQGRVGVGAGLREDGRDLVFELLAAQRLLAGVVVVAVEAEELAAADDHHMATALVAHDLVDVLTGHASGAEHAAVLVHAEGHHAHQTDGGQLLVGQAALKVQRGVDQVGGTARVPAGRRVEAVQAVPVAVDDQRHAVDQVGVLLPPLLQPVDGVALASDQQALQLIADATADQLLRGALGVGVLGVGQQRAHAAQVALHRLGERRHGERRQHVLETVGGRMRGTEAVHQAKVELAHKVQLIVDPETLAQEHAQEELADGEDAPTEHHLHTVVELGRDQSKHADQRGDREEDHAHHILAGNVALFGPLVGELAREAHPPMTDGHLATQQFYDHKRNKSRCQQVQVHPQNKRPEREREREKSNQKMILITGRWRR
mmetsp:Transcript_15872/g.47679  ORF Transcript_15872/g.47679 Transcript_15872/m.47679 type:complete len:736 (+) Transcript_15872:177-2384(+)